MSSFRDLYEKCEKLDLGGVGPKTLIELLAQRRSWREDKLEAAYYKATSPTFRTGHSNFRTLIVQFLEHGLIREREAETGYRFALNSNVWEQDVKLFEALNVLVYFFHSNSEHRLRVDCNLNTFLRRVVGKLENTPFANLHYSVTYPIAGTIVSRLRDFSGDESIQRFRFATRTADQIKAGRRPSSQPTLFQPQGQRAQPRDRHPAIRAQSATPDKPTSPISPPPSDQSAVRGPEPETGPSNDPPPGLPYGCVKVLEPTTVWQPVIDKLNREMLRASPFADRNALIMEMHVTSTRRQRVMIAVMKRRARCHLLVFSLCGVVGEEVDLVGLLAAVDIDPSGAHPALLRIDGERVIGVVLTMPFSPEQDFFGPISTVGKLADHLEASFWGVDEY